MKAEEICVGDILKTKMSEKPFRVKNISGQNGIQIEGDEFRTTIAFDVLEPVPLTPEIMEKNGFVDQGGCVKYWYQRKFGDITVSVFLHQYPDNKWITYDYWIQRPFEKSSQYRYTRVWRELDSLVVLKKTELDLSSGDSDGLHILQHAMTQAGVGYKWEV